MGIEWSAAGILQSQTATLMTMGRRDITEPTFPELLEAMIPHTAVCPRVLTWSVYVSSMITGSAIWIGSSKLFNGSTSTNTISPIPLRRSTCHWASIGTPGNVPGWATLEDEFAQLEADNIFISVAAGNAFQNYNSPGLAYPAVSSHVVPVSSHGADGTLSDFSQRHDRVLVAPGESIRSTVPGHLFGSSESSGFLSASGTSMAAPYVAGASAVLRQAMFFMGYENIDQEMLFDQFRETSIQLHDSVTGSIYHRLDLGAAVDAVIADAHGDSAGNATALGTLSNPQQT